MHIFTKYAIYRYLLFSIVAMFFVSCGDDENDNPITPSKKILDIATQEALHFMMDTMTTNRGIPGAIVMVQKSGYEPWFTSVGYRETTTKDTLLPTHSFLVGSISKTFVGAVILQLIQEKKIGLDDKLVDYLDVITLNDQYDTTNFKFSEITIRQLLSHTSGMGNYLNEYFVPWAFENRSSSISQEALIDSLNSDGLYFAPGTSVQYSNSAYITLGLLAEKVTGKNIEDLVIDRYIEPMGLTHSYFPSSLSETSAWLDHQTHGYAIYLDGNTHDVTDFDPSYIWAAGAVVSNAEDLLVHLKEMLTGSKMLNAEIQQERLKFVETEMHGYGKAGFGLAIAEIGDLYRGHSGGWIGYNTNIYYRKDQDAYIITFVNRYSGGENPAWDLFLYVNGIVFPNSPVQKIVPSIETQGLQYSIDPDNSNFFIKK